MSDQTDDSASAAVPSGSRRRPLTSGRKALLIAVAVTLCVTAVLGGSLAWAFWSFARQSGVATESGSPEPMSPAGTITPGSAETTSVPDVVSLPIALATQRLLASGLKVGTVTSVYVDGYPVGSVVSQSPSSTVDAVLGSAVALTVSKGTLDAEVPKVVGLTLEQARRALGAAGLTVEAVNRVYSETVDSGIVIALTTADNEPPQRGDSVIITASKGRRPVPMPLIVGQSPARAVQLCAAKGLGLNLEPSTATQGIVYRQSPAAGAPIVPGTSANCSVDQPPRAQISAKITAIDPTWEKYNKQLGAHVTCTSTSGDDRGIKSLSWRVLGLDVAASGTGSQISFILPGYRRYGSTAITLTVVDSSGQTSTVRQNITVNWDTGTLQ